MSILGITLLVLGLLLTIVGSIWMAVLAFMEHVGWGLAYLLLPFAGLVFVIMHWGKKPIRKSFFLALIGFVITLAGGSISFISGFDSAFNPALVTSQSTISIEPTLGASPELSPSEFPAEAPLTSSPSLPPKPNYRQHMVDGYAAFNQGDYQTALINFKKALNERPNDSYAVKAIQNTQISLNRGDYKQYMTVGYAASAAGDHQTALINFKKALNERPNDSYALKAIQNTEMYLKPQE